MTSEQLSRVSLSILSTCISLPPPNPLARLFLITRSSTWSRILMTGGIPFIQHTEKRCPALSTTLCPTHRGQSREYGCLLHRRKRKIWGFHQYVFSSSPCTRLIPAQYTSPTTGGNLVTPTGEIVGKHDGMWYYTIGQGAKVSGMGMKMFVAKKGVGVDGKDILVVPGS